MPSCTCTLIQCCRDQPHLISIRSLDNPGDGSLLARFAVIQCTMRRMNRRATSTTSRMSMPTSTEEMEGRLRTTGRQLGISVVSGFSGFLVNAASATAESLPGAAPEMGARLDAPAAASFGAVVVAFGFLQVRKTREIWRRFSGSHSAVSLLPVCTGGN